jgi:methyl-accepting chemotaxis protein
MPDDFKERIQRDERDGEVIINYFRLALAAIYLCGMAAVSLIRHSGGFGYLPWRAHAGPAVFLIYSLALLFYIRKRELLPFRFKYVCAVLDMTILAAAVFLTNAHPENSPPFALLPIQAVFYMVLIVLSAFRYDARCAFFTGFYAGFCYLIMVVIHRSNLDIAYLDISYLDSSYRTLINSRGTDAAFPLYYEIVRIAGMIAAGAAAGMACKRHLALFLGIIESRAAAATAKTTERTKAMAKTIQQSTNEIFLFSKDIFTTANNQASSVQEIESTINENTRIAADIAEKTGSVATIASRTEEDVKAGVAVLERNIVQMEDIKIKNDSVISGIISLGNKITKIRDIIKNINTITDQTKVIAFNAALEAAGAGDKGKRFSVVANEVNRLAGDIAALTKQIREQVEEIQDFSASLIISSEESADKITEGRRLIKDLEEIFGEIKNGAEITASQAQTITVSTQKQQKSTEQINVAIADISQGLNSFIHSTEAATASAEGLTRMIENLEKLLNARTTADDPGGVSTDSSGQAETSAPLREERHGH